MRDYTVSLLKAWWGAAATEENDFCFDYLPRLTGSHSTYDTVMEQIKGTVKGYFLFGENPAVGSANTRMQRLGMSKLDWLVVRDFSLIESATWWKDGPEIESGEMRTEEIATEVFFFPAAAHIEKDGTFTNTQRMLQWHHKAQEPQDEQRSDLWFIYHLGKRVRERLAGSSDERDRPVLELTWDYPTEGEHEDPSAERRARRDQRLERRRQDALGLHRAEGRRLDLVRLLDLLRLLRRRRQPDGAAQARARAELDRRRVGLGVAGEPPDPLQPRLGRPRGQAVERAQGARLVGRGERRMDGPRHARLRGRQAADYRPPKDASGPAAIAGDTPFIMQADQRGWLFAPAGVADGPLPTHYEPQDSPVANSMYPERQRNPARAGLRAREQPLPPRPRRARRRRVPVRRHDLPADRALHGRRHVALDAVPRRAAARVLLRGLARARRGARARARRLGDADQRARRASRRA